MQIRFGGETYRKMKYDETQLQVMLARWLDSKNIFYFASLAGVNLGARVGGMRKRMGCKAGVHDLIILVPRGKYHGMTLELKIEGGDATKNQIEFRERATTQGYYSVIMPVTMRFQEAFDWAVKEIEAYLRLGVKCEKS